jgi:hypothetical protein
VKSYFEPIDAKQRIYRKCGSSDAVSPL